jgi:hypothetical protein
MANLYEILANAEGGQALAMLGRQFGLTSEQTEAAVTALLPAISTGLKKSTATPEGLGNLFGLMGQQQDLQAMYDDPATAFGREGRAAGNDALAMMFGSPDVSRAVADQAQDLSGVGAAILKKMLPVLAGLVVSGMMRGSGQAAPSAPPTSPAQGGGLPQGGGLGDILGQIFGRGAPGPGQAAPSAPPTSPAQGGGLGDILGQILGGGAPGSSGPTGQQIPTPSGQPIPVPTEAGGQPAPGGDLLGHILRELEKGIREGRVKPVIIGGGPVQIPMPGGQAEATPAGPSPPQVPGGDIFGQILRDILGGAAGGQMPQGRQGPSPGMRDLSDLSRGGGVGAAVFGDLLETGRDVEQRHLDNVQRLFERFQR